MDITIKKLTPELCGDFLYYFDNVAFSDHEEWAFCYCLECHLDKETQDKTYGDKALRREMAKGLVDAGVMQGYLAYDGEQVVGWCNTDDKVKYRLLTENEDYRTEDAEAGKIKVVYCYDIAPAYRGKGIAEGMLQKACADAGKEGYLHMEAYPFTDVDFGYQYHGTVNMYRRNGFRAYSERKWFTIMRKELRRPQTI